MTAHELIDDIFRRQRIHGSLCWITRAQFDFLLNLIGADEEGGALRNAEGETQEWRPSGRAKYRITPPVPPNKLGKLEKLMNLTPSNEGRLF